MHVKLPWLPLRYPNLMPIWRRGRCFYYFWGFARACTSKAKVVSQSVLSDMMIDSFTALESVRILFMLNTGAARHALLLFHP